MGTVVVIVLTVVMALAISWVTWLVTQHIIAEDRKRLLDEGKPSIPPPTFDDRLRELRDTFQSVYDLLYPDPSTRPVAGVGWCPPSPADAAIDWFQAMQTKEPLTARKMDDLVTKMTTRQRELTALVVERDGLDDKRRFAAMLQRNATAIRERNASRD